MTDPLTTAPTVAEVLEAGGYRLLSDGEVALLREGFEAAWRKRNEQQPGPMSEAFQAFLTQRQEKETR